MVDCKPAVSPGCTEEKEEVNEDEVYLTGSDCTKFRRAAARFNYMSLDRPDLSYASKVLARGMANPTESDVVRLKRILRYLRGTPNMYICYSWQDPLGTVVGYGDSDWAGCRVTRKSTSGGAMFFWESLSSQLFKYSEQCCFKFCRGGIKC